MFGQYQYADSQYVSGSEEDSSTSQTLSFPWTLSKKKVVPLHKKIRNSNTNRVLQPLRIDYSSPENARHSNSSNSSQEKGESKERFVANSHRNIQTISENEVMDKFNPVNNDQDSLEDLFPSYKSESNELVPIYDSSGGNSNSQMDLFRIHEEEEENMEVVTSVANNVTNFCVLEDIGNQNKILKSKLKVDVGKTSNWNQDFKKGTNDKENNVVASTYPNKSTLSGFDIPYKHPATPAISSSTKPIRTEDKNIIQEDSSSKKKIDFQTPNKVPRDPRPDCTSSKKNVHFQTPDILPEKLRSESVMMPPPPVPQMKLSSEQKLHNYFVINEKNYYVESILGRGGSSKVYQVIDPETSRQLAVKEVDLSYGETSVTQGYLQEVELLRKLQGSKSVIKMIDHEYIEERERLYLVMEKGETDLSRIIKEITKVEPMPISLIVHYWIEMLRAVKDIHAKNVIHSDLKPANFLLVGGRLKLIDFGIASSVKNDMTSVYKDIQTGTYNYISPEALQMTSNNDKNGVIRISYKSDIWSLGCILYNLLYGKTPFQHIMPPFAKFVAITNKNHCIEYPDVRKDCPPVLLYAVKRCLRYDPKTRPTAVSLLELQYFSTLNPESYLPE